MTLLITGRTGFVMSVLARYCLETEPRARVVILDAAAADAAATRYFAGRRRSPFDCRLRTSLSRIAGVKRSHNTTSPISSTALRSRRFHAARRAKPGKSRRRTILAASSMST